MNSNLKEEGLSTMFESWGRVTESSSAAVRKILVILGALNSLENVTSFSRQHYLMINDV